MKTTYAIDIKVEDQVIPLSKIEYGELFVESGSVLSLSQGNRTILSFRTPIYLKTYATPLRREGKPETMFIDFGEGKAVYHLRPDDLVQRVSLDERFRQKQP